MSERAPSLWRAALATVGGIGAIGGVLVALWPTPRALAVEAELPRVLTAPDAGPAPSQVPPSKPCGAFGRPEQPAICFKRFLSAGENCHHECSPLAGNAGWLAVLVCSGDPEPDAKVLP